MNQKHTNKTYIVIAILAALSLGACSKGPQGGPGGPGGKMPPAEVGTVVVSPQTVALTTELPGRTSPYAIAEIRPQVGGLIQQRAFTEGGDVKAGQLLYQIDPALYQAAYESAKAAQAKSEANLVTARLKAERYKDLVAIKAVAQQDYDDAQAAYKQAEAAVAADKAALETARINLGYTHVGSPITGRIGKSTVTQGALVTANQATALASVQQLDPIYVDVTQSTTDLMALKRDLLNGSLKRDGANQVKIRLLLEDGTPYPLEGKLAFTDVTVDQTTGSVVLRAVFPNPKLDLLPGMYVRAVVEQGKRENALLVPQPAVSRDTRGNAVVMVVGADGKFMPQPIKIGQSVGNNWLVTEGLKGNEQVIVEGLQKLRPGTEIKPVPAGSSAPAAAAR